MAFKLIWTGISIKHALNIKIFYHEMQLNNIMVFWTAFGKIKLWFIIGTSTSPEQKTDYDCVVVKLTWRTGTVHSAGAASASFNRFDWLVDWLNELQTEDEAALCCLHSLLSDKHQSKQQKSKADHEPKPANLFLNNVFNSPPPTVFHPKGTWSFW